MPMQNGKAVTDNCMDTHTLSALSSGAQGILKWNSWSVEGTKGEEKLHFSSFVPSLPVREALPGMRNIPGQLAHTSAVCTFPHWCPVRGSSGLGLRICCALHIVCTSCKCSNLSSMYCFNVCSVEVGLILKKKIIHSRAFDSAKCNYKQGGVTLDVSLLDVIFRFHSKSYKCYKSYKPGQVGKSTYLQQGSHGS